MTQGLVFLLQIQGCTVTAECFLVATQIGEDSTPKNPDFTTIGGKLQGAIEASKSRFVLL